MDIILSIIIPVYKAERYLRKCIDSVLAALKGAGREYEIILVDDGSPDKSGDICDGYAAKYEQISVIHKENGGPSDARNFGIKVAKGKFLTFVDSDDWVTSDMSGLIPQLKQNEGIQIFYVKYEPVDESGEQQQNYDDEKMIQRTLDLKNDSKAYELLWYQFTSVLWRQIIQRRFLEENNLLLNKALVCGEDFNFSIRALLCNPRCHFFELNYYRYVTSRPGSICNTKTVKYFYDTVGNSCELMDLISADKILTRKQKKYLRQLVCRHMLVHIFHVMQVPNVDIKSISRKLRENKRLFAYPRTRQQKRFVMLLRIFGYALTVKIISARRKVRNFFRLGGRAVSS